MKKIITFFAAFAAVLSCSKENPVDNYNPADDTYSVTLTASAPGADTKTTLVDDGEVDDNGKPIKSVHWSKGDAIKVLFFPGRHENDIIGPSGEFVSHFVEDASASANFRIDKWSFGMDQSYVKDRLYSKGIAVYPSSANASSTKADGKYANNVSDVSFTLPSEQNAVENNIESNLNFSYADVDLESFTNTINNPSHQTKLTFNNVCALIQLTMPAELPKVTQIAITSNDKVALTGHGSMNYTTGYNQEVNGTVTVTDGKNVILKNADGFKAGAKYYAVVWPGVHESGLTIEFTAEGGKVASKSTKAVTLNASTVKPYTFNKGLEFTAPVQDFNYIYADGKTGNDVKSNIVGVVIYRGNPKEKFNDPDLPDQYCNGLAIGLSSYSTTWGGSNVLSGSIPTDVIISSSSQTYDQGGYTVKKILNNAGFNNLPIYINSSYPNLPSGKTSGWYLGSKNEWNYIYENLQEINNLLSVEGLGAETVKFQTSAANGYWLPLNYEKNSTKNRAIVAYGNYYGVLQYTYRYNYTETAYARPIFAF